MGSDIDAERFIVSAGNYSYREIFELMAVALKKKKPRIYANSFITGLVWRFGKAMSARGRRPVITKETAANAHAVSLYDNQKLLKALPSFNYTPVSNTIERMARAFLDSHSEK